MSQHAPKVAICLWYDHSAEQAAKFYARTFPASSVGAIQRAPTDYPGGKQGDALVVAFTVLGIPCIGLNGGPTIQHNEAFSRSRQPVKPRPTATGTPSSVMAAPKAKAAGARTNGVSRGRSRPLCCWKDWLTDFSLWLPATGG